MPVNPYHLSVSETFRLPETRSWRLWKVKRGLIKCGRLCVPHVLRHDGDLTVGIPWPLWAGKFVQLLSIGSINDFWNGSVSSVLHLRVLARIPWVHLNFRPNSSLSPAQKTYPKRLSSFM